MLTAPIIGSAEGAVPSPAVSADGGDGGSNGGGRGGRGRVSVRFTDEFQWLVRPLTQDAWRESAPACTLLGTFSVPVSVKGGAQGSVQARDWRSGPGRSDKSRSSTSSSLGAKPRDGSDGSLSRPTAARGTAGLGARCALSVRTSRCRENSPSKEESP